jgi:glucose/arabinose dehydrogenase
VRSRAATGLAAALAAMIALALPPAAQPAGSGDGGVVLRQVGVFDNPTYVAQPPGNRRLLFVTEQAGLVRVIHRGRTRARPFLDLRGRTTCGAVGSDTCGERGLLSIAFPPDYAKSRRFYVYYTARDGAIQVDEYRRARRDPTLALPSSRRSVLTIPHSRFPNHNGGQLQFHGHELLLGTGDGGGGGDTLGNAENTDSLLGKLLRIYPRPTRSGRPYGIPRSNPFVGKPGRDEIFSYGLRNPYRFSIEEMGRGPDRILIGDVGQNRFEEIDYATLPGALGANFGWNAFEGFEPYVGGSPDPGGTTFPILAYGRDRGCAVNGGYVVRDRSLPTLFGRYLYADFCAGELRSFIPALAGARDDKPVGPTLTSVSSFGQTPDGQLYVASLDGGVYRIAAATAP